MPLRNQPTRLLPVASQLALMKPAAAQWPYHRHPAQLLLACRHPRRPAAVAPGLARLFHASGAARSSDNVTDHQIDNATNHYEALNLVPSATPEEIKKSFYTLSKSHHPDHNRSDPNASQRFMRLREAYATLSNPSTRTRYDREVLRLHHHHGGAGGPRHGGSYSSANNPAGGRPATGLSRRRTTFRGPPPSFYRSGGWGDHGAKRSAAHDESTGGGAEGWASRGTRDHHNDGAWTTGAAGQQQSGPGQGAGAAGGGGGGENGGGGFGVGGGGGAGGMGPGQDPFGHRDDVPHFDKEGHERTGRRTEARMRARRSEGGSTFEPDQGMAGMFFVIGGILAMSFLVPLAVTRLWKGQPGEKKSRNDWDKKVKG
ncbi:hypothetical protein BX600DRAFT_548217 [Xylariales sp. PMI_506]|nr:hypothetical protein BX600DRAFT_548217 [Xylariales sp. PMI_506]